MAHCAECGADVPAGANYCKACGAPVRRSPADALLNTVLGPRLAPQYAGAEAIAPVVGPPLTTRQVLTAVGGVLLAMLFFILYVNRDDLPSRPATGMSPIPVVGSMGEAITLGGTVWGVAFLEHPPRFGNRTPQGQYFAVGVVIGNRGNRAFTLSAGAVGLQDTESGTRYTPLLAAWGTPDELSGGKYTRRYPLAPRTSIAGLLLFDVPTDIDRACLLVRDIAVVNTEFTGAIALDMPAKPRDR